MLINKDSDSTLPVVFSLPPTDDICPMPTPPSTPASLQRFPLSTSLYPTSNTTFSYCSQDSLCSDHQMVLPEHDEVLTPSSTPPDVQMGKKSNWDLNSSRDPPYVIVTNLHSLFYAALNNIVKVLNMSFAIILSKTLSHRGSFFLLFKIYFAVIFYSNLELTVITSMSGLWIVMDGHNVASWIHSMHKQRL